MSSQTIFIYGCLFGVALLLMGMGLCLAIVMPGVDRWSRYFFIAFFSVLLPDSCLFLVEVFFYGTLDMVPLTVIAYFLMSVLSVIPLPMMTLFLLHFSGENWKRSPLFYTVLALGGLYLLLLIIAQSTSFFYYVSPDNQFHFGSWYPLMIGLILAMELLNISGLFRRRHKLKRRYFFAILISLMPLTVALIVHLFVNAFPFIDIGIAISAFSMYAIILSDQIEQNLHQQQEIARQNANIMVLQMRPHFIHNTLLSIYYLCRQDPVEAQRVTLDFNTYLEKNLNALASSDTIPFSEELGHTRAYLNVEQALYEENLFVDYDTPHIGFRVPPLTLQPIVENAVKHALDPDSDPLHISIKTRKTDFGSEIIVSDNGPGFSSTDDDKPHIALTNIKQRLEMMCKGKMTIMSRDGGGTVVKLMIP